MDEKETKACNQANGTHLTGEQSPQQVQQRPNADASSPSEARRQQQPAGVETLQDRTREIRHSVQINTEPIIYEVTTYNDDDEMDDDSGGDPDRDNIDDPDLSEDDEDVDLVSVYAHSLHPDLQSASIVMDGATIDSARTIYAQDIDYIYEHDKPYLADYHLPYDANEQARQWLINQIFLRLLDLELTITPVTNPTHVLDVGTGVGEWAVNMAEKYRKCEVFGTDIAPIQPSQVPSNVEFVLEDAEDEWLHTANHFDLVHLRNMEGAFSDWDFIYQQAFLCLKPGGWIEVIDWVDWFADPGILAFFPPGSAFQTLARAVREAVELTGKPRDGRHLEKQRLTDVGFVDFHEKVYELGIGALENDWYGRDVALILVSGLEAECGRLLTKYLGWDFEDVVDLCKQAGNEIKAIASDTTRTEKFAIKARFVIARKPLVAGQWTAKALNENGEILELSGDESATGGGDIVPEQAS